MNFLMIALAVAITLSNGSRAPGQASTQPDSQPQRGTEERDSPLTRALLEVDRKARLINDLKADFKQAKHTALLKKPLQSEGRVRVRADSDKPLMRWDTTKPSVATTLITADELRIHTPNQKLLEIYPIDSAWSQLVASPLPKFDSLREQFTISEWTWKDLDPSLADERIAIKLAPKEELIREHVLEVHILIDRQTSCVVQAEVLYPDQDRLELWFSNIRLNTDIHEEQLELKIPAGTTISRPLEPNSDKPQEPRR